MFFQIVLSSLSLLTSLVYAQSSNLTNGISGSNVSTYTNPILNEVGADPWVIRHGDYYYM
jgi:beta-xylosidase